MQSLVLVRFFTSKASASHRLSALPSAILGVLPSSRHRPRKHSVDSFKLAWDKKESHKKSLQIQMDQSIFQFSTKDSRDDEIVEVVGRGTSSDRSEFDIHVTLPRELEITYHPGGSPSGWYTGSVPVSPPPGSPFSRREDCSVPQAGLFDGGIARNAWACWERWDVAPRVVNCTVSRLRVEGAEVAKRYTRAAGAQEATVEWDCMGKQGSPP